MLPQQLLIFLPGKEAILPQQLLTFPQKVTVHPRPSTLPQLTIRHQLVLLLRQLLTFLPGKEAFLSRELLTFPWGKEAIPPRLLLSFQPAKEAAYLRPPGPPMQVRSAILPGHSGKAIGSPLGSRATQSS